MCVIYTHETLFSMVLHFDINFNKKSNWCNSITLSIKKERYQLIRHLLDQCYKPTLPLTLSILRHSTLPPMYHMF